ncbi:hypothetical protein Q9966_016767 [Columba livia]|nr:hypothetical protein Q9966_016767 [Columba livia]
MAIWDAVATYIHDHLLSNKGVRIPTLGSFDVVTQQVQVGDEDVTIHRPTFNLARNLVVGHNLVDDKSYLPGNKELEPIKYSKVAATASVSRRKVEGCVQGTLSLFSYCLGKGQNVALLLKDIGVLLLEATKVDMRFYHHFLEALAGKDNLQKVVFQVGDGGDVSHVENLPPSLSSNIGSLNHIENIPPSLFSNIGSLNRIENIPPSLVTSNVNHIENIPPSLSSNIGSLNHIENIPPSLFSNIGSLNRIENIPPSLASNIGSLNHIENIPPSLATSNINCLTLRTSHHLYSPPLQVPEVLDTMLSPMVPLASLCSSGRTIVFPRFAVEVVAKPRPNESQRAPAVLRVGETALEMMEKPCWKWWRNHVGNGGETTLEMVGKPIGSDGETSLEMVEKPRWRWWRNHVGNGGETSLEMVEKPPGDDGETMLEMMEKPCWKWWRNPLEIMEKPPGDDGETALEMMKKPIGNGGETSLEMMENPPWR